MKRTIKKWLSLLLTAAMILSLGVTAFAGNAEPTQDVSDSEYAPTGVGDYADLEEDSTRTITATLSNEGGLPDDIVRLILPVVSSVSDVFDMYLDPNDLLQASYGQKYGGEEGANPFADEGAHVYFKHAEEDENGKTYTKTSDKLTIVNKSNVDVDISLDAAFSKGSDEEDYKSFSFVKTESDLSDASGAAMFLELQAVVNTAATDDEAASSSDPITGAFEDVDYPVPTAVSTIADAHATLDTGVSFIDSVEWVWSDAADDDIKAALNAAFNELTYTFAYAENGALSFHGPDDDVTAEEAVLEGYSLSAPKGNDSVSTVAANATSAKETVSKSIGGKSTVLATITFNLNREAITAEKETVTAESFTNDDKTATTTVTFSTADVISPAQVKATIAKIDGAYNTIWVPNSADTPHVGEYHYELNDTYAEAEPDMFNSMDFNLVAAINQHKAWTETVSEDLSLDVVWTITPVASQEAVAPSVTVTSATTSTSGQVVMDIDLGSGSKAATTVKQFRYTTSGNAAGTLAVTSAAATNTNGCYANGVLTIKTPTAIFNGSNWKVIFTLTDGSEFEVPVNIKAKG